MNKEVKKLWLEALWSGQYVQETGASFCEIADLLEEQL